MPHKKETENKITLLKSGMAISMVVLLGKLLGFLKQSVIASAFGANGMTDLFFSADGYTSLLSQILRDSMAPAVLTQYIRIRETDGERRAKKLIRDAMIATIAVGLVIIGINIIASNRICDLLGLAYSDEQKSQLRFYLLSLLPVILFTSVTGVSQGHLDANKRFLPGKLCSLFFSISIIVFIFAFKNLLGVKALLFGFLFGYLLHTVYIFTLTARYISGAERGNPFKNEDIRAVLKLLGPLIVGNSVVDLGHLVDKIVASSLESGSVSALQYGQVISSDVVNAVLITTIGTVLLPSLTKRILTENNKQIICEELRKIMLIVSAATGLITSLYLVVGRDFVRVFFERGSFSESNSAVVTSVALCYSAGLLFMANREILVKAHYAFHDTAAPMVNSVIGVVMNLLLSILFSKTMGVAGIALATSCSMIIVFVASCITIKRHLMISVVDIPFAVDMMKIIASVLVTFFACRAVHALVPEIPVLLRLLLISALVSVVYVLLTLLVKESAAWGLLARLRSKLKNRRSS